MKAEPSTMNPKCVRIKGGLATDCRHATDKAGYWCLACKRQFMSEQSDGDQRG